MLRLCTGHRKSHAFQQSNAKFGNFNESSKLFPKIISLHIENHVYFHSQCWICVIIPYRYIYTTELSTLHIVRKISYDVWLQKCLHEVWGILLYTALDCIGLTNMRTAFILTILHHFNTPLWILSNTPFKSKCTYTNHTAIIIVRTLEWTFSELTMNFQIKELPLHRTM